MNSELDTNTVPNWRDGLSEAIVKIVESLGGPDNEHAKTVLSLARTPKNPLPEQGTVKREIQLQTHSAIRQDF